MPRFRVNLLIDFISSASHEWNRPEYGNTRNGKLSVTDPLNNDLDSGNKRYFIHSFAELALITFKTIRYPLFTQDSTTSLGDQI